MNPIKITDAERGDWTSASSAQADALCPARHLMQKGIPDEKREDAIFGDLLHEAAKTGDTSKLDGKQLDIYESSNEIEHNLCVAYFGTEVEKLKANPVREQRYWIQWADGLRHSGQVDCLFRKGAKALITDRKSLSGDVAVSPRNMQLRDLACLVDWNVPMLTEVGVAIIQPLVTHKPDICIYTKADIMRAREELYFRVERSNKGGTPVAGEVQCKWCKAKGKCPEYQKWSTSMVKAEPNLLDVPVSQWTPEMRRKFCDGFDIAQAWLNNAWSAMEKGALEDPAFVPGYEMVDGTPRPKIKNLQAVFDRFSKSGGSLEQFMKCATITKGDLEDLTRLATKLKGKALKDKVVEVIGDDVEYSTVKKSLKKAKQ